MASDLDKIRAILLGQEYDDLLQLKADIRDPETLQQTVATVITEAIEQRSEKDDSVSTVLAPTIDQAIAESIDQDPKKLAESLYPVMGPAIRKSISETMQQMLENFNQLLEQSLSPQSLRWRFDAWRTGRSYSEIVLLNTLEYEVEQVFLIHRETSLLVHHVFSDYAEKKDPDMVSGMFSAIQDFVEDSFSVSEGDVLDTLKLGELSVVIQRGPLAVLAAVVRGSIPEDLRANLRSSSEILHRTKASDLQNYQGDPATFYDVEDDLRQILAIKQKQPEKRGIPWLAIGAILIASAGLGYWYYLQDIVNQERARITALLNAEPGIVVLEQTRSEEEHVMTLLLDPLAVDPQTLITPNIPELSASRLIIYPYLSAEDDIVIRRAKAALEPLEGTQMTVSNGTLKISGAATQQWLRTFDQDHPAITGVNQVDVSELAVSNPVVEEIGLRKSMIESFTYAFEKEQHLVVVDDKVKALAAIISRTHSLQAAEGLPPARVALVGYTDDSGSTRFNRRIGTLRAQALHDALVEVGLDSTYMDVYNSFEYAPEDNHRARQVRIYIVN